MVMLIPLGFLAFGSIMAGLPFKEIFAGHGVEGFFRESLAFAKSNTVLEDMHHVPLQIGIAADRDDGARLRRRLALLHPPARTSRSNSRAQHEVLYKFLLNKWYFDEIYDVIFVRPTKWLGRSCCGRAATAG